MRYGALMLDMMEITTPQLSIQADGVGSNNDLYAVPGYSGSSVLGMDEWEHLRNLTYPNNVLLDSHVLYFFKKYTDVTSEPAVRYALVVIHVTLTLIAVFGNSLVLLVIYRRRSLRRNTAIVFIFNLAVCDLFATLFYRPIILVNMLLPYMSQIRSLQAHVELCRAMTYMRHMFAGVGFHTILAISQERLFLIVFPLKAKSLFSSGRSRKVLVFIWLLSIGFALPIPLKFAKLMVVEIQGTTVPFCGLFDYSAGGRVYFTIMFIIYYLVPCIVVTASYIKIFLALYSRSETLTKAVQTSSNCTSINTGNKQMRVRRNLAKMMLAVAIIFSVCWGPYFGYFFHTAIGGRVPENGFFLASLLGLLPLLSSSINPFIYTLNSKTFRMGLKALFTSKRKSGLGRKQSTLGTFNGRGSSWLPQTPSSNLPGTRTSTFSDRSSRSLSGRAFRFSAIINTKLPEDDVML